MSEERELPSLPPLSELTFESFDESIGNLEMETKSFPEVVALSSEDIAQLTDETEELYTSEAVSKSIEYAIQQSSKIIADIQPLSDLSLPAETLSETQPEFSVSRDLLLSGYLTGAALRYTYQFDFLTPVLSENNISEGTYSKLKFQELPQDYRDAVFAYLTAKSVIVPGKSNEFGWMLRDDERRQVLKQLVESDDPEYLKRAIGRAENDLIRENRQKRDAREETETNDDDEHKLERLLWDCLKGKTVNLKKLNRQQLLLLQRVVQWFSDISSGLSIPSPDTIIQHLGKETLLQPFRHLTGKWLKGQFVSYFTGREEELSQLYEYLSVLPPKSLAKRISRFFKAIKSSASQFLSGPTGHLPLLIYGPGGIGKSTLLAKFLLEHLTETNPTERFPYAYLDFDLSVLDSSEPLTILAEMARQLAVQFPASADQWNALRSDCLESCQNGNEELNNLAEQRNTAIKDFTELIMASEDNGASVSSQFARNLPFLLVLDTFEEIQYRNRDGVKDIFRFLNELRSHIPQTKVILMGRAPLGDIEQEFADLESVVSEGDYFESGLRTDFAVNELPLGELRLDDARKYLSQQGISDPELLDELVKTIGGNPLSLRLIAQLMEKNELDLKSLREEINWRPTFGQRLFGQNIPPKEILQGILFRRFLGHIHNNEIEKLAHPGLVLRRITPAIIKDVLAVPCGLGEINLDKARDLFDLLAREVSLVRTETDDAGQTVLFHRPELRKIMLKLIDADENKHFEIEQVHQNAIRFYADKPGRIARTEELYHRLIINQIPPPSGLPDEIATEEAVAAGFVPPPSTEDDLIPVWRSLSGVIEELPDTARIYLDARLNLELVSGDAWEKAGKTDWELMVLCRVSRRARERESAKSALETLYRKKDRHLSNQDVRSLDLSSLSLIEAVLLERLGRYEEGLEVVQKNMNYLQSADEISSEAKSIRLFQYILLKMRLATHLRKNSDFKEFMTHILDSGSILQTGKTRFSTKRYLRQLLRFAADSLALDSSSEAFTGINFSLSKLAADPTDLQNCPILVCYSIFVQKNDLRTYLLDSSIGLKAPIDLSICIGVLKTFDRKALSKSLVKWTRKSIKRRENVSEHFSRVLEIKTDPKDERGLEMGWGKLLNKSTPEIAEKLEELFAGGGFSPFELEALLDVFVEQFKQFDFQQQVFEEARRLGDLLPGEGVFQFPGSPVSA